VRLTTSGPAVQATARRVPEVAEPRMKTWTALLTAVAGGLALAEAFPPAGIWPLAVLGPALLVIALWRQRLRVALAAGLVFGVAFFYPLLSWEVNLAWYVWVALATGEAVIFAVLTAGQWLLLRLRAWPLAAAGWWVAAEAVRDRWPWGGFPWGRLVMSQAASPTVRWVAVGGPAFLTFLIALTGTCLAWVILGPAASVHHRGQGDDQPESPGRGAFLRPRALAAAALVAAIALSLGGALLPVDQAGAGQRTAVVAAIQGDVPHATNLPDLWRATKVTQNHAQATLRLEARIRAGHAAAPQLVIWPENSTDQDPSLDAYIYATIWHAVAAIDRPVLVGAVLQKPVRNAGQLWLPGKGPVAVYIKRRLVPFGEVIPFRSLLAKITNLPSSLQPVNFTPGHRAVVFKIGNIRLGDVICYEVSFDGLVSSEVNAGANLLAVQTNDADFEIDGQTGETLQQLAMARVRAVEFNRAVVVASTTGVSAIIRPDGSLIVATGTWRQAEIEARVPLRSSMTIADRIGGWPEGLLAWATVAALAWSIALSVRQRRRRVLTNAGGSRGRRPSQPGNAVNAGGSEGRPPESAPRGPARH
jgi:apolipoprotein N-acyltransferase